MSKSEHQTTLSLSDETVVQQDEQPVFTPHDPGLNNRNY